MSIQRRIADQQAAIKGLINQARGMLSSLNSRVDDGDRFGFQYIEYIDFVGGQFNTEIANFAISKDSDFVAKRLNIYFGIAPLTNTGGFVPIVASHTLRSQVDESFNILFGISESIPYNGQRVNRELQNQPIPGNLAYSAPFDSAVSRSYVGHVSSLVFDEEWELPRGSTVQVAVTPTQSFSLFSAGQVGSDIGTLIRAKIILQGYKKVRAFK
jgi:hypothetical protein